MALWIILGIVSSIIRKTPRPLAFIVCGLLLSTLSASIIVLGQMSNIYFGPTWQIMLLLVAVFAIGEVSRSERLNIAAVGACALSVALCLAYPPTKDIWMVSPDCHGGTSVNYRALSAIAEAAKSSPSIRQVPSVFATFAGDVSAYTQSWLAAKNNMAIKLSDLHRSGSADKQLERAQKADFVEVADPNSKWMYHWLPTGPIQGEILSRLRTNASFQELEPIKGTEGVLYLFQKKGP